MKKAGLVLCGLTPFLFGRFMDYAMMTWFSDAALPYKGIGIVFLLIWTLYAFLLHTGNEKKTIVLLHAPATMVLVLLFIQDILLSAYWPNAVGTWTQMFFLPLLNIGYSLTFWGHRVFWAYAAGFLLMLLTAYLGCKLRKKLTA